MKKELVTRTMCMFMAVVVSLGLIACVANTEPGETEKQIAVDPTSWKPTEPKEEPTTEPIPEYVGNYSLDYCKSNAGVYIAYEDGSFDRCASGGYCYGLSSGSDYFYGMFLKDSLLFDAPDISRQNDSKKLVVFSDIYYTLTLHPIHAEVACFSTETNGGIEGYGKLIQVTDNGASITIHYDNHERETANPIYINGKPASEYEADKHSWSTRSHKGISRNYSYSVLGFQREESITFGVAEGTTLVENTYQIDSTYYDCDREHNFWENEDIYWIMGTPTADGYAEVDISGVPSGKYVMVFRFDGKYRATILTIGN